MPRLVDRPVGSLAGADVEPLVEIVYFAAVLRVTSRARASLRSVSQSPTGDRPHRWMGQTT